MDGQQQYWATERQHCNRMIAFIFFSSLSAVAFLVGLLENTPNHLIKQLAALMLTGSGLWILLYGFHREKAKNRGGSAKILGREHWKTEVPDNVKQSISDIPLLPSRDTVPYHPFAKIGLLLVFYALLGWTVYRMVVSV